jgi:hypothetical protein
MKKTHIVSFVLDPGTAYLSARIPVDEDLIEMCDYATFQKNCE